MEYQNILHQIQSELPYQKTIGKVASYIPELEKVPKDKFAMHLYCLKSGHYHIGSHEEKFSIQSISKVFSLSLAMSLIGDDIFKRFYLERTYHLPPKICFQEIRCAKPTPLLFFYPCTAADFVHGPYSPLY